MSFFAYMVYELQRMVDLLEKSIFNKMKVLVISGNKRESEVKSAKGEIYHVFLS